MSSFARAIYAGAAALAGVLLAGQAPAPDRAAPRDPSAQYEAMCERLLEDRSDLMPECRAEQELAHHFTTSWLQQHGFLAEDGSIDALQILGGQHDGFGLQSPGAAAAFCLENGDNWIGISECITALDANAPFSFGNPAGALGDPFMDSGQADSALPSGN